jgi:ASCH domain-containing protein
VKDPWAELIALGIKDLEVRSWRTHYRGPLVIVSSVTPARSPAARAAVHHLPPGTMLRGGITVCIVDLVDCRAGCRRDEPRALVNPAGAWVWELANPRRLAPLKVRGQLNLWHIEPSLVVLRAAA